MKIREGFVSNSSSSSFVIVTTPEAWKNAKKKLVEKVGEKIAKIIVEEIGKPERAKVFGQDALVFSGVISSEEYGYVGIARLREKVELTEEEEEKLSVEAYDQHHELDKILKEDGISFTSNRTH